MMLFLVFLLNATLFCALQQQDQAQTTPPSAIKGQGGNERVVMQSQSAGLPV